MTPNERARVEALGRLLSEMGRLQDYIDALKLDRQDTRNRQTITFCDERLAILEPLLPPPARP